MAIFLQPLAQGRASDLEGGSGLGNIACVFLIDEMDMAADGLVEFFGGIIGRARCPHSAVCGLYLTFTVTL